MDKYMFLVELFYPLAAVSHEACVCGDEGSCVHSCRNCYLCPVSVDEVRGDATQAWLIYQWAPKKDNRKHVQRYNYVGSEHRCVNTQTHTWTGVSATTSQLHGIIAHLEMK